MQTVVLNRACEILETIRNRAPRLHNIAPPSFSRDVATALLALGATPIMARAKEEAAEIAAAADALIVNIGAPDAPFVEAALIAGRAAKVANRPIVFGTLGAEISSFRMETAKRFIDEIAPDVVCASAETKNALGLDDCAVAIIGDIDYAVCGDRRITIANGHPLLARLPSAAGVAASVIGAALAVTPKDPVFAAATGLLIFNIAGEMAAATDVSLGTFFSCLIDALDEISSHQIRRVARVTEN